MNVMISPRRALLPLLAIALAAGCSASIGPRTAIEHQTVPFYYYDGRPIYLRVDPARLTVATTLPMPEAAREVLAAGGIAMDSATHLAVPDHWVIWLAQHTTTAQAVKAAELLRQANGFAFASNAYRTVDGDDGMLLVNTLVVDFTERASAEDIARLAAITGTAVKGRTLTGGFLYAYPPHSEYTPLEIAAYYYRQPVVEWADPDKIGEISVALSVPQETRGPRVAHP